MNDDQAALQGFDGRTRLFPLPNLVLFPQVVQGLHIFEPRYRQMTADALQGDRLISIVLLRPGWEDDYDHHPAIEPVACLGRITHHEHLPDGRYNLRLRGVARLKLADELTTGKLYRSAQATILPDEIQSDLARVTAVRRNLAEAVLSRFEAGSPAYQHLLAMFAGDTPLGPLCDMLGYALPLPPTLKQQLLAEVRVETRAEILTHAMRTTLPDPSRKFPPEFSPN